jgi:glutathione S-transferase
MITLHGAADAEPVARINPDARVTVVDDDGLIVRESMAINLYLADRYGGPPFWPEHPRDRALVSQWSLWSQTEIDVHARHTARFSGDAALKKRTEAKRRRALGLGALADWLAGCTGRAPWERLRRLP